MTGGRQPGLRHAVDIVHAVCQVAGVPSLIDDIQVDLAEAGVLKAINRHDTPVVFDWLAAAFSYQGISDAIAYGYMARHGQATWADIQRGLDAGPSCPKLQSYWHFHGCRYRKGSGACAEPDHIARCPLPRQNLRNGHLNQAAYSLFLFIRDIADGDLVGWLDHRLAEANDPTAPDRLARLRQAVLEPLRNVYGVSDKVLSMALSSLLLGAGRGPRWVQVGGSMIAVDTLVHNFLVRTGILRRLGADHPYGPACYRPSGCADIIERVAGRIDAREFNPEFPANFPRFVQHAIWFYCAQSGLDVCNGNRIDDRKSCQNIYCRVFSTCARIALYKSL